MLINLSIRRKNGSKIEMADGTVLHFKPDADGDHVADVEDEAHIECLLRIPEYKIKRTKQTAPSAPVIEPGQNSTPAQPTEPAAIQPVPPTATSDERAELVGQYTALFGQAPHPAAKIDTLRAKIAEKKAAQ